MNIATYTDAPSYDAHQETTIGTLLPVAPTYDGIVQYGPEDNTKVISDLAEKWEVSPDGLTYTFQFAKGVKWHDGKPFTAADAKFTLDRIRKPPQGMSSVRRDNFVGIKDVDVVDDNTLRVTLKYPMASFVPLVAMGWNVVVPKHVVEPLGGKKISTKEAIGTGPYVFKEYVRGVKVTLTKNPDYFVKGRPYVDGMDIFIITDPGATLAAIRTGQVHHVSGVMLTPEEAGIVRKSSPEIKLIKAKSLLFPHFGVNAQRKPYNDVRVRKAIFLALDRQAANRILQNNEGEIGGPLSPGSYFALPQEELLKMPGYRQPKDQDIAEAKKLMAEAGYADGFDAEIKTWGSKINSDLAVFLIDQMKAINIRMKMRYMETAAFYAAANNRDYEVYAWSMGVAIEDPDQMFAEHYITKAPRNYGDYTIPGFDELYVKQSQTMDRE
ncbi:MAG: ABC transporter substrate-binding protein, partial [Chloroflexota bacterium]|nr:ABC transporter substrate-binding protein [Chloroflexota bacterium]